jgi:hypothetical protein
MRLPQEYEIGYRPDINQSRWGNPQTSAFGNTVRAGFNPYAGTDYFAYQPYMWADTNFGGVQPVGIHSADFLYGDYHGYRGILPVGLQGISPEPYPYQLDYPYNRSA